MDFKEIKSLWKEASFRPNKKMGQNFLIDKNIRDKIISLVPLSEDRTVLEIGSGFGVMTFELAKMAKKVDGVSEAKAKQFIDAAKELLK